MFTNIVLYLINRYGNCSRTPSIKCLKTRYKLLKKILLGNNYFIATALNKTKFEHYLF